MALFGGNSGDKRRKLMPTPKSEDVDVADVLGFEAERKKRRSPNFETTKEHFKSGAHFESCIEVNESIEAKREQIRLEEERKAVERLKFQEELKAKEEEKRKADMAAVLEPAKTENSFFQNPISKEIGSGPAQQFGTVAKEQRLNEVLAPTDRVLGAPGARNETADRVVYRSQAERTAKELSNQKPVAVTASAKPEHPQADEKLREERLAAGAAFAGARGVIPNAAGNLETTAGANDKTVEPTGNEGFTSLFDRADLASPKLEERVAARAVAERSAAAQNARATTNLSAATSSTPGDRPTLETPSTTSGDGPVLEAAVNRTFSSPVTSITGENKVERKEEAPKNSVATNTELGVVYERGSMLVCTEPLRPALDVCVVVSSTEVNTDSRYITVAPIEKRNSPLNESYAVDMPQTRGCFTIRCDWLRSIDVSMVSRVEKTQLDSEKLDQIDRALLHTLALSTKTTEPE